MALPQKTGNDNNIESVLLKGDLANLSPEERLRYYSAVCQSIGLNPLTKPFEYIVLNGKLQLYALRACTDQLRDIKGVSIEIVSRDISNGILTIHVRARMPNGRSDEDLGSVNFPDTLKGDARANAELKAITKAKRRVTLSICGLGWLDETEVEDIPAAAKQESGARKKYGNPSEDFMENDDIYDAQGNPVDNIPMMDGVEPTTKNKDARSLHSQLIAEIRSGDSLLALELWAKLKDTQIRVASLPGQWQDLVRDAYRTRQNELGRTK